MARVNLTLDEETFRQLERHASQLHKPRARLVVEIVREGLARRESAARRRRLAADYAAGRADARSVLADFEAAQLDLLDDDDA